MNDTEQQHPVPGDIYVERWGYSMTLYSFYRVVRVTAQTVVLQELPKTCVGADDEPYFQQPHVVPDLNATVFRDSSVRMSLKKFAWKCDLWDGKPKHEDHMD